MTGTEWHDGVMTIEQDRVGELLRDFAVGYGELTRHMGETIDLPASDAMGLAEIAIAPTVGPPMTPARLARHVGLTSGATNALINRLESRGLVVRSRESEDRRIVTLRPTPHAAASVGNFAAQSGGGLEAILTALDPVAARAITAFLTDVTETIEEANKNLRQARREK